MRRTFRTLEDSRHLLEVAAGRRFADRYLDGATLLNVYSGEMYHAGVAIARGRIAYVGPGRAMIGPETDVLSLAEKTLVPGYIDPHTHISGIATPLEYAREILPRGTTAVIADTLHFLQQTPPALIPEALGATANLPVFMRWLVQLHSRMNTSLSLPKSLSSTKSSELG